MNLTLSELQQILKRTAIILEGMVAICLVISIIAVAHNDVFAKQNNTQLIADIPDNGTSQHASGHDRNTEHGKSGTQGKSESNPDGNGADKRRNASDGAQGGTQGYGDYDDNNGCGNDNDFADDNNGNCGGKPKPSHSPKPSPSPKPSTTPSPKPSVSPKPSPLKVKICHATGSTSNPYVLIVISDQAVLHGHQGHPNDIIPAPNNGCPKPQSNPDPSPSPNPHSSPSPTPTPSPTTNVGSSNDPSDPELNNSSSNTSTNTIGQVLSASVPKELPATGADLLSLVLTLGAFPLGLILARYKKI